MTESRSISVADSAILIQNQMTRGGPGRGFSGRRSWRERRPTGGTQTRRWWVRWMARGGTCRSGRRRRSHALGGAEVVEVQRLPFLESHHKMSRRAEIECSNDKYVP